MSTTFSAKTYFEKSEEENEKNEGEIFQLLYYLCCMDKSGTSGFPKP